MNDLDSVRDLLPCGLISVDTQDTITHVNAVGLDWLGYTLDELAGRRFAELLMPEGRALAVAALSRPAPARRLPLALRRKNGGVLAASLDAAHAPGGGAHYLLRQDFAGGAPEPPALGALLDSVPTWIFFKDTENRFLRVSQAFAAATGLDRTQLEGRSLFEIYPRAQAEAFWRDDLEVIASGRAKTGIIEAVWTASGERWAQTDKLPHRDAQGRLIGIIGFSLDITRHKRAEDALRHSEERYRGLVEQAVDGIFIADRQGRYVDVNSAGAAMLGRSPQDILKLSIADVVAPEEIPRIGPEVAKFAGGRVVRSEWQFRRPDGTCFPGEVVGRQLPDGRLQAIVRDISERRRAEAALRGSEETARQRAEELETLMDSAPMGIWLSRDPECRIIFGNQMANRLLEVEAGQNVSAGTTTDGRSGPRRFFGPDGDQLLPRQLPMQVAAARGMEVRNNEVSIRLPSGRAITLLGNASPLFDARGRVRGSIGVFMDITERKRAETELRRINRVLVARSHSGQATVRAMEETSYLNDICQIVVRDCGYAMVWIGHAERDAAQTIRPAAHAGAEAGYLDVLDLTWADTGPGQSPIGRAIRSGRPALSRHIATDPNFAPWRREALARGYAACIALPLLGGDGTAFGAIVIYSFEPDPFTDAEMELLGNLADELAYGITMLQLRRAHRAMERDLRRARDELEARVQARTLELEAANEALGRREADLKEAQRLAGIGSYRWDLATGHLDWSEELYRLVGRDPALAPIPMAEQGRLFARDAWTAALALIERARETGEPFELDMELLREDGGRRWVVARGEIEHGRGKSGPRMYGTLQDITERKRAEEELRRYRAHLEDLVNARTEALQAANQELEAFAYSVSHDLRTPLRAIDGFSRILIEDHSAALGAEGTRLLGVVRKSTDRMSQLIDDLLSFSRMGRKDMVRERVDMAALARSVWEELRPADGRPVEFALPPLPEASGDPAMLRQVWVNLLGNAVKFTSHNQKIRIEIGTKHTNIETIYHIKDNGAGFDMRYADKLFGVFQRLHGHDEFEGTGIGLAIVKRIIGRHGGRVRAQARIGEGATFYFTLPNDPATLASQTDP